MSQQSVTSKDGTPIAYWQSGQEPPLVLVHGTAADHGRWTPALPAFEQHFTACAVDRRGRGASGDSEDYAIEGQFEDIAAVVDSLGEPAILLGHSYGALCALEAALLTTNVSKLLLYEPGIEVAGQEIHLRYPLVHRYQRVELALGVLDELAILLSAPAPLPDGNDSHAPRQRNV